MRDHHDYRKLLEPGHIGHLTLRNRIVMASMGTRLAGVWGEVNDATLKWYAKRAHGEVGLVTVEAAHVAAGLFPVRGVIRMLRVDDDCFNTGLFSLAEIVHQAGSKISIQLSVGRAASAGSLWMPGQGDIQKMPGMAPSQITFPDGNKPRQMTIEEIRKTIDLFGLAAARVKSVGFDAIELHAHFHSIPGCFMSPLFNKRKDEYGGSFENRLRFVLEIIESMRQRVGQGFPLMIKYSINEYVEGGRNLDDGLALAKRFEQAGVDAIVVSQGQAGSRHVPYAPLYSPEGYMVPMAEALKKVIHIPVIVGGRLGDPLLAVKILQEGKADFISMGRSLIADPDLPRKVRQGIVKEIRPCIGDNYCFQIFGKSEMKCTLNVAAGREIQYGDIKPAEQKKKIVIVGAGPAGMEAARVAGLRGHKILLYEKEKALGQGQLALAAAAPHKDILKSISRYYGEIFKALPNIELCLGKEATVDIISKEKPDAVIIASGGKSFIPDMPGVGRGDVVTAFDVLAEQVDIKGKNVIVCGGNAVGCETASYLAKRKNNVTIIEQLDGLGRDMEFTSLSALRHELEMDSVTILTGRRVEAITDRGVTVLDNQGEPSFLQMDMAVLAMGVESVDTLSAQLEGKVKEIYTIGDAKAPGKIHDAVTAGFFLAYHL